MYPVGGEQNERFRVVPGGCSGARDPHDRSLGTERCDRQGYIQVKFSP